MRKLMELNCPFTSWLCVASRYVKEPNFCAQGLIDLNFRLTYGMLFLVKHRDADEIRVKIYHI